MMKILAQIIFLWVLVQKSFAYPMLFTCEDHKIKRADQYSPEDKFNNILRMNKETQNEYFQSLCHSGSDCIDRLKLIADFSKSNFKAAYELFEYELQKLNLQSGQLIDENPLFKEIAGFKNKITEVLACEETMTKLNPDDYIWNDNYLLASYPFHTNYMYVTGCNSVNGKDCYPIGKINLDSTIERALLMDTDPYLIIALTLMEEGTSMGSLYLDPIGLVDAIGCKGKQVANHEANAFDSYGTKYIINAEVVSNTKLQNNIQKYLTHESISFEPGNDKFCMSLDGSGEPKVVATPNENSCCLELGVKFDQENDSASSSIKNALRYEFIRKRLSSNFRGRSDPEFKIQRFNGYTELMGAAEGVQAWRQGINFYEDPQYGYQSMDFILNSLMFNPYIRAKVDAATDSNWKSIICLGREDGTYFYDSKYYFEKVRDSKRLTSIYEKFKKGLSYNDLTQREQNGFYQELFETSKRNPYMPNLLPERIIDALSSKIFENEDLDDMDDTFIKRKLSADEIWVKKNLEASGIDRKIFDRAIAISDQLDTFSEELGEIYDQLNSLRNDFNETCDEKLIAYNETVGDEEKQNALVDYKACREIDDLYMCIINFDLEEKGSCEERYKVQEVPESLKLAKELSEKGRQVSSAIENLTKSEEYLNIEKYFRENSDQTVAIFHALKELLPFEEQIKRYAELTEVTPELKNDLKRLYDHYQTLENLGEMNKPYQYYFENIYESRDTLGETSDYSWRELNEQEQKKILDKIMK